MTAIGVGTTLLLFLCYGLSLVLLPALLFPKRRRGGSLTSRFLFYVTTGNAYLIFGTLLLAFFGFTARAVYQIVLWGVPLGVCLYRNRIAVRAALRNTGNGLLRLLNKETGLKTALYGACARLWRACKRLLSRVGRTVGARWWEWLAFAGITAFCAWYFSYYSLHHYGMATADVTTHLMWVERMADGEIYAAGVYPFGFHSVMLYLYEVCYLDPYLTLRLFPVVQDVLIAVMLYVFGRSICRSRVAPLVGYFAFSAMQIFDPDTMLRFNAALPQEFAMVFLLPLACCLIRFLRLSEEEKRGLSVPDAPARGIRLSSELRMQLLLFSAALYCLLSAHFFMAVIALPLCGCICLFFLRRTLSKRCLVPLMLGIAAACVLTALPMAGKLLLGTPLEGSFRWAQKVVAASADGAGAVAVEEAAGAYDVLRVRLSDALMQLNTSTVKMPWLFVFAGFLAVDVLGCVLVRDEKKWLYRRVRLAVCVFCLVLLFLFSAEMLGLPTLMEAARVRIFIAYCFPLLLTLGFDLLPPFPRRGQRVLLGVFAALAAAVVLMAGGVKKLSGYRLFQYDSTVACTYDIIRQYPRYRWTLVSTGTETRLVWNHGWHTELSVLLRDIGSTDTYTVPTEYIFLLVEKQPLPYNTYVDMTPGDDALPAYADVTAAAVTGPLTRDVSPMQYYQKERETLMAHAYRYANAYMSLYPDDMSVYYEDERIVCYRIVQNTYSLKNLAIKYWDEP